MNAIQEYATYSNLSQAAYAEFNGEYGATQVETALEVGGKGDFTAKQAANFTTDGWEVVDQSSDTLYGDSSFSATLFHNTQTGEYVFANRGTAEGIDFFTDGWGIATLGLAGTQVIDMYRYYKQLVTPAGQAVTYSADEIDRLNAIGEYYAPGKFWTTAMVQDYVKNDKGLGKLSTSQTFAVTGHSLGGHLSLWLNALIPSGIEHVYTFNGAGQGNILRSAITAINGVITGTPISTVADSSVTSVYGYGGPAVIAGVGGGVGQQVPVNIEYKGPVDASYYKLYNHSIIQLGDAIAVANVLSKLDATLTIEEFNTFFNGSSNAIGTSLESVLDGLRQFFGKTDITPNDNREQFYNNLTELQDSPYYQTLQGRVQMVVPPADGLAAKSDFGALLSLYYLTPFELKPNDDVASTILQSAQTVLGAQWIADRDLSVGDRAQGKANFSDQWLKDRAHLLQAQLTANGTDVDYKNNVNALFVPSSDSSPVDFIVHGATAANNYVVKTLPAGVASQDRNAKYLVEFGSDGDDSGDNALVGAGGKDRLYGGGGNDQLDGAQGDDYLEGNAGNDSLMGGAGMDQLLGGDGDDTLNGGTGNDMLEGGAGNDMYQFTTGDGTDTVIDSDGQGRIVIDGIELHGGKANITGGQVWTETGNDGIQYTLIDTAGGNKDLRIAHGSDSILVKNYTPNALGIELENATPVVPAEPTATTPLGGVPAVGGYTLYEEGVDGAANVNGDNLVATDNGNNKVKLGNGNNAVTGGTGNDTVSAGGGNNVITGGGGQDIIVAGSGANRIYAGTETDLGSAVSQAEAAIATGEQGTLINVGNGNNTLVGGNGNDLFVLGDGNNMVVTGPGDTTVFAGVGYGGSTPASWSATLIYSGAPGAAFNPANYQIIFGGIAPGSSGSYTPASPYHGNFDGAGNPLGIGNDTLIGGKGNDVFWLSNGDNYVDAGSGNDLIFAGAGTNLLFAGSGNDTIMGGGGNNYIDAESGNDLIVAEGGNSTIFGGTGNSTIYAGSDTADWATSSTGNNYIEAGSGNSKIYGSAGNDTLVGGSGNDQLWGGAGTTVIFAGDGGTAAMATQVVAGTGNTTVYGGNGIDNIFGGSGINVLYAGDGGTEAMATQVVAGTGDTTIYGGSGIDAIFGGSGTNVIYAGDGGTADHATSVTAGTGDTTIYGGSGQDAIFGGAGNNGIYAGDGGSGDQRTQVSAGSGNTTVYGGNGVDQIFGGSGNDLLYAGDGGTVDHATYVGAGSGSDTIVSGAGYDYFKGASNGKTTYLFNSGFGSVEIANASGADTVQFGTGISVSDLTVSAGFNADGMPTLLIRSSGGGLISIDGGMYGVGVVNQFVFADGTTLTFDQLMTQANAEPANVAGDTGVLQFNGAGNTSLVAGNGNDFLFGWGGNDTLIAGAGADTLVGGTGNNTFVINNPADMVVETTSMGTNTVLSSVSYTLPQNVQNLTLTGSADLVASGNEQNGTITANSGNDTLIAGSGNETLVSGAGNDQLVGGTGGTTYYFSRGGGKDTVAINSGVTNIIQFAPDVLLSDVALTRSSNGDLVLQMVGSEQQIVIQGVYPNAASKLTAIRFGDGTQLTASDFGNLPITIADVDGVFRSNGLQDTIIGASGNSTFDGGQGDTLIEGGGNDTFLFKYGLGRETVVDTGANVIQLDPGMQFSDLTAQQHGSDLTLYLRGIEEGIVLKNYFDLASSQSWAIRDTSGNTTNVNTVLADATAPQQNWNASVLGDYIAGYKAKFMHDYVQQGYHVAADGSLQKEVDKPFTATWHTTHVKAETSYQYFSYYPAQNFVNTTQHDYGSWDYDSNPDNGKIYRATANLVVNQNIVNGGSFNGPTSDLTTSSSWNYQWVDINWHFTGAGSATERSWSNSGYLYSSDPQYRDPADHNGNDTGPWIIGLETTKTTQSWFSRTAVGQITETSPGENPFYASYAYPNPPFAQVIATNTQIIRHLEQITINSGDNIVRGGDVVQAGSGNDTIYSSGFIQGGSGNDVLRDGAVIAAGTGNADMDGGGYATRYLINPTYQGTYFIHDSGGLVSSPYVNAGDASQNITSTPGSFADKYYQSIGFPNWRDNLSAFDRQAGYATLLPYAIDQKLLPALPYADDYTTLLPLYTAAGVPLDQIEFGPGISLQDLSISWADQNRTLVLSWGNNGKALIALPGATNYGYGIEQIKFADGSTVDMGSLLAMAPARPPIIGILDGEHVTGTHHDDLIEAGPGNETLSGGLGNDTLVAGAGNDLLDGGAGNSVYVFNQGFADEVIFNSNPTSNHSDIIRFGTGIAPSDIVVTLDNTNLYFQVRGTTGRIKVDLDQATSLAQVQFGDGSVWTVDDINAHIVAPSRFTELGDQRHPNGLEVNSHSIGTDVIGATGSQSYETADSFYRAQGIYDWAQRYSHAGQYFYVSDGPKFLDYHYVDEQGASDYASSTWGISLSEALDDEYLTFVEPLPVLIKVASTDLALSPYYDAHGDIPQNKILFGPDITVSDLHLSWGQVTGALSGLGSDPQSPYTTLDISLGNHNSVRIMIPHSDDPAGSGVNQFEFADGTVLSLNDMIALAPPAPSFDPTQDFLFHLGMGQQILSADLPAIQFAADISSANIDVSRDGMDLLLINENSTDSLRIPNWYANPASIPATSATFADGTVWDTASLTGQGLIVQDPVGNQTLTGLPGYANTLIAGVNDTLVGGSGNDTFVINAGSGVDHIIASGGNNTLQLGNGIDPANVTLGVGSLLLRLDDQGDAVHIEDFDPADALGSGTIQTFKFVDGTTLTYEQLLARGFDLSGSGMISGTSVVDRITGSDSQDTIDGGAGNDTLDGGAGDDTYLYQLGDGLDSVTDQGGNNTVKLGDGLSLQNVGIRLAQSDGAPYTIYSGADSQINRKLNGLLSGGTEILTAHLRVRDAQGVEQAGQGMDFTVTVDATGNIVSPLQSVEFADGSVHTLNDLLTRSAGYTYDINGHLTALNYDATGRQIGHSLYSDDGQGNITLTTYLDSGDIHQSWIHSNGAWGTHDIGVDHYSYHDIIHNADGSFNDNTYDYATNSYRYLINHADGSSIRRTVDAANKVTWETDTAIDGSYIDYTTYSNQDGSTHQTWTRSNGSSGIHDTGADHYSYHDSKHNADGSSNDTTYDYATNVYHYLITHADSSTIERTYDATNKITWETDTGTDGSHIDYVTHWLSGSGFDQSWTRSDGTAGTATANPDGSPAGNSSLSVDGRQSVNAGNGHLMTGGANNDTLSGTSGSTVFIGGAGDDTITTGNNANVIAFDLGDGRDIVNAMTGQDNTLSLGGHFSYADLTLQKSGNDLVLDVGANDSVTLKNWYASAAYQNIVNLQVIAASMSDFAPGSSDVLRNAQVENFDFHQIASAFDQARAENPGLSSWDMTNALLAAHLASSDTAALAGDLTYEYGMRGNLTGMGVASAQAVLSDASVGTTAQSLHPWSGLNAGMAELK